MIELPSLIEQARSSMELFSLKGKHALVIGGNRGLGQAMSLALAAAGADVCVVSRGPDGLKETAQAVTDLGRKGLWYAADVTVEENVEKVMLYMLDQYGSIDILVNSQSIVHLEPAVEFDTDVWQRVIDVNLKSIMLTCKHAGRVMLKQGKGKIINISLVRGFQGRAQDLAYAPSKGAVNQLTKSLAIEWGPSGINVNGIAPVFTLTNISAPVLNDPETLAWVLGRIPMKRLGQLNDLFGPVLFLASEAANFVNGHTLLVDGGWVSA